jgi:hypothetical protein
VIYIAGGYLRHSLDKLEAFNADDKSWRELAKLPVPRSGLGGAFLKVKLSSSYKFTFFGGLVTVFIFDFKKLYKNFKTIIH